MLDDLFNLKENEEFIKCFDEFENICLRKGHFCKINLDSNNPEAIPSDYLIEFVEEKASKIIITITDEHNEVRKIRISKLEALNDNCGTQIKFFRKIVSGVNYESIS